MLSEISTFDTTSKKAKLIEITKMLITRGWETEMWRDVGQLFCFTKIKENQPRACEAGEHTTTSDALHPPYCRLPLFFIIIGSIY